MYMRIIIVSIVLITIVSMSATIYSLHTKNTALKDNVNILEQRVIEKDSTIKSLEYNLVVQQQHIDNTTLKFKQDYNTLYNSYLNIKEQHDSSTRQLVNSKAELAKLYNDLVNSKVNRVPNITLECSLDNDCKPSFKLTHINKHTKFTIYEELVTNGNK